MGKNNLKACFGSKVEGQWRGWEWAISDMINIKVERGEQFTEGECLRNLEIFRR